MKKIVIDIINFFRPFAARGWVLSFVTGALSVGASAQSVPAVVMSQTMLLGKFPAGGAYGSGTGAGTSFAIDAQGNLFFSTSYGNSVVEANAQTGTLTTLGSTDNPGPVAIDAAGNLYIGDVYNNDVIKLPLVNGAYPALAAVASAPPACTGTDTTECLLTPASSGGYSALTFDAAGDLFYSSAVSTAPSTINECTAASLKTATPVCTQIFQEASGSTLYVGGLAVDPYGNLFFTDSLLTSTSNENSSSSYLKELPYTSGTGFAAAPATLYTLTIASPSNYDNQLQSVATDISGTVYFSTVNDGIFAFTNSNGVIGTTPYTISPQGAKIMGTNGKGLFYVAAYNNSTGGDSISRITVSNLTLPSSTVGSPSTASVTTALNDIPSCTGTPSVSFAAAENGAASSEFSAATSAACASTLVGNSTFPTTVTFTPSANGAHAATLTATDSNGGTGNATVSGSVTGAVATPVLSVGTGTYTTTQTVTISDSTTGASIYYTTDGVTMPSINSTPYTSPITVSSSETLEAVAIASGMPNSTVASATYTLNLPQAAAPTFSVAAGIYTAPQSVTLSDATAGATIYYTTDGSTPTTSSTQYNGAFLVSNSETVNAIAVAYNYSISPLASAAYIINAAGTIPAVVMSQTMLLGKFPAGGAYGSGTGAGTSFAIDAQGNLFFSTSYGNSVVEANAQTGTLTTLGSTDNPGPVAIDAAGNLYIGDVYNNDVIKLPLVNGAYPAFAAVASAPPACTGTDTTECLLTPASSGGYSALTFDAAGDLFYSSAVSTAPSTINECTAASLKTATPVCTQIFQEASGSTLYVGGLALDPYGNLFFFTDSLPSPVHKQRKQLQLLPQGTPLHQRHRLRYHAGHAVYPHRRLALQL